MAVQVIQTGATVRVIVNPRAIANTEIVDGFLVLTYTDGTTDNVGYIGGGGVVGANIFNTPGISSIAGSEITGFIDAANDIDARLTALGY